MDAFIPPEAQPKPFVPPEARGAQKPFVPPEVTKPQGFVPPEVRAKPTLASEASDFGRGTLHAFEDIPNEVIKQNKEALEAIKGDFTSPVRNKKGGAPGALDYAARAGRTALDIPYWLLGGAALSGASTSIVGRPVEKATGIPRQITGDVVSTIVPFAGDINAASKAGKIADAGKAVEKLFSPTTVSPESRATEKTIRRATGQANLEAEKTGIRLVEHNAAVANLPVQQQRALVSYIENRSKYPNTKLRNPALQKTADAISDAMQRYRSRIQAILPSNKMPGFITDYYAHMWKDKPSVVGQKMGAYFRQGSGRSLKKRTLPTLADGIAAGLTPKFENPIETTVAYAQNMSRFLATHDIQSELRTQGYAKWFQPGSKNIPQGWVPLNGIMTEKGIAFRTAQGQQPTGRIIKLFAPPDVARVYNNFISKGLEQGDFAPFFQGARHLANGLTMLKLGLSPFHLNTMANEAMASEFSRFWGAASRGELKTAARSLASVPAQIFGVKSYMRGLKMERELLDLKMPDALSKKVNDAFIRSGGQLRMDPFYRARPSGSFFNAFEKGTFKRELSDAFSRIYRGTPWEKAKGTIDLAGNVIQSVSAPLFEKYIPRVKRGAFASTMSDWLRSNPNATQEQIDAQAIKVNDSIDNRFGELVNDNLFWHRQMKQIAQTVLLSATWDLGTIREIAGGLKDIPGNILSDIPKGKGLSTRAAYVAGLATQVALMNAIYQYMKTGHGPQSARDLMAARTGGRDAVSGQPERVMMPGYQKDVYAFGYDFPNNVVNESLNKLNPLISTTTELARNKDYRGLPILPPEGVNPTAAENRITAPITGNNTFDFILDQAMPISLGNLKNGPKKGSNIGRVEQFMIGDRPAPAYITAPERQEQLQKKYGTQDWKRRVKADARAQARQQ